MDISLQSEQFKNKLLNQINQEQLPPVVIYYIIKDINNIIEDSYRNYLNNIPTTVEENKTEE